MGQTTQAILDSLEKHRLVADDKLAAARQWLLAHVLPPAADAGEHASRFLQWLVEQELLTPFQREFIEKGKAAKLRLGDYLLIERIGAGRMAGVYKARKGGQTVAIKILPPDKAKDEALFARFQREGRLAARLKHPNVVRTHEMGEANGLHYIAMEYLEGETLDEMLKRRRRLPPHEAARLLRQSLEGLQHLHEQDVVHRDLKPANLMLTVNRFQPHDDTSSATLKILDVGLGRTLFDDVPDGQVELTETGDLLGTAGYMAPEQARDARQADVRCDLYSLGCVFYHALAGQPPFVDKSTQRVIVLHATQPPKLVRDVDPSIPTGLAGVIDKLLAKDPAQRFATPQAAMQALDAPPATLPSSKSAPIIVSAPTAVPAAATAATPRTTPGKPAWPLYGQVAAVAAVGIAVIALVLNSRNQPATLPSAPSSDPPPLAQPDDPATRIDSEPTVASLAGQLKDEDAGRRAEAVRALAQLGERARPAYADLVEALKDTDASVRDDVGSLLGALKPTRADLPAIRAALREPSDKSRAFAASALAQLGVDARQDLGYLRLLAEADSAEVRDASEKSIQTLETILIAEFIRELSDSSPDVRRAAALELGQIKSDPGKALPNLIEAMSDKNSAVRVAAADALVMIGPEALPVLVETLKDKNVELRKAAIACLGRMGPDAKEAVPALVEQGADPEVAREIQAALTSIGPFAIRELVLAYETQKSAASRKLITDVLAQIGPEALPTLKKLGQNDAQAQRAADEVAKSAPPAKDKPLKPLTGLAALYEGNLRGWFTQADRDDDEMLDKPELALAIKNTSGTTLLVTGTKNIVKNPASLFLSRLDRDGDGVVSRAEFSGWARDFAEFQAELTETQEKIADTERRLLARKLSPAMRLEYEAATRRLWANYYALRGRAAHLNQMGWLLR